jgi:ABC-type sugar transport system permease subunit
MKAVYLNKLLKGKLSLVNKRNLMGYWFVLPFVLGLIFLFIPSLVQTIQFSFNNILIKNNTYELINIGFEKYRQLLFIDPDFVRGIVESVGSLILNTLIILVYSLLIANILNRDLKGKGFLRAILFLPVIIATGIIAKVDTANVLINSAGTASVKTAGTVANGLFSTFDITSMIMSMKLNTGFINVIVATINNIYGIITGSGIQMIIFLAGLQGISLSVYESATVEGATWWESFWKITIPMISPLILVNLVYTIIDSFTSSSNVVMDRIYNLILVKVDYSLASAMSLIYFTLVAIFLIITTVVMRKFTFYETK